MNWTTVVVVIVLIGFVIYRMLPAKGVKSISMDEVKELLAKKTEVAQFVDVREPSEFRSGHVPGFQNIPLGQIRNRVNEIQKDRPVVLMCHSGTRSMQAARTLVKQGFTEVRNVSGGMMAWKSRKGR